MTSLSEKEESSSSEAAQSGLQQLHSSPSSSNISNSNSTTGEQTGGGDQQRGPSPIANNSINDKPNVQLVVAIGKGFSNLIEKNLGLGLPISEQRQRRKVFAMLWHMSDLS